MSALERNLPGDTPQTIVRKLQNSQRASISKQIVAQLMQLIVTQVQLDQINLVDSVEMQQTSGRTNSLT